MATETDLDLPNMGHGEALCSANKVNVRSGPGQAYKIEGQLVAGQRVTV
jgi:uncharacterized protein YgiM (DUF1202 family)